MRVVRSLLSYLSLAIFCSSALAAIPPQPFSYSIFVDAGSSGSRLHLFKYKYNPLVPSFSIPEIQDVYSINTKPGLSSYVAEPQKAGESLKNLFDEAKKVFDKEYKDPEGGPYFTEIPVHVMATAGVRALDPKKQELIINNVNDYLHNTYHFTQTTPLAEVISGSDEALYGWLDVNYLYENFQKNKPTVGSIDMGGASTQIAYVAYDTLYPESVRTIQVGDQSYSVFNKSFQGLGQDLALKAIRANPSISRCYPKEYSFEKNKEGDFNAHECGAIYAELIKDNKVAEHLPLTYGQSFVAYSGIYYTFNFLQIDKAPTQINLEEKLTNEKVCGQSWGDLQKSYPSVGVEYLAIYCANGAYFNNLLFNTYHINDQNLEVRTQINQKNIDWTLGAALYFATPK